MDLIQVYTIVALVAGSLLFDWWYFLWARGKRLPPGPKPWPIVGNLPQMQRLGQDFVSMSKKLEAEYGEITTFWMGKRPIIFVNDAGLANDALVKQGMFFANRCKFPSQLGISGGNRTLNASEGAVTATLRKNIMTHMLGPAKLKAYEQIRNAAYEDIISVVKSAAAVAENGEAEVNVNSITRYRLVKLSLALVFGLELEDDVVRKLMRELAVRITIPLSIRLGDYISACRLFERKARQIVNNNQKACEDLLGPIIDRLRPLQGDNSVLGGNYCETLFQLEKENRATINNSLMTSLCCEFLNASVHTTSSVIDAAMALLGEHPEVQKKLYEEIEATVGSRTVDETDLPHLPYLSAVFRETLRFRNVAPLALAHATSELRKLGGYDIPTDAIIFFNLESFHHNPNHWSDPLAFRPKRFLENDLDVYGIRDFSFLPFSAGRRVCPGTNLAMLVTPTVVARMVQKFEWRPSSVEKVRGKPGSVLCARPRAVQ